MSERGDGRSSFRTILMLMAIPLCGMAIFFLWQWLHGGITPKEALEETKASVVVASGERRAVSGDDPAPPHPSPLTAHPSRETPLPRVTPKKPSSHRGDIVLIIDDLGFDGQPLERLMALDPNLNAAILPNGTRAADFAERLHARGFEVLCHLPMQPRGRETPGANAILTSMADDEIARLTRENIEAVPHARGVNNHMGSLATSDRRVMESVLRALPDGMYFIDSRTAGGSVAAAVAQELNVPTATRHVFLDDVASEAAVRRQVAELAAAAEKRGLAIGIGHPYPVTLRVLSETIPQLRARLSFRPRQRSREVDHVHPAPSVRGCAAPHECFTSRALPRPATPRGRRLVRGVRRRGHGHAQKSRAQDPAAARRQRLRSAPLRE